MDENQATIIIGCIIYSCTASFHSRGRCSFSNGSGNCFCIPMKDGSDFYESIDDLTKTDPKTRGENEPINVVFSINFSGRFRSFHGVQ